MKPQTTREHLLEVGLRHIRATGYGSTGVKEILDEANVPKGSFYHHFPSKETFAVEVLKLYGQREIERCELILGDSRTAPLKRLRKYFDELIDTYGPTAPISGCLIGNLSLEVADHSDALQSILQQSFAVWQSAIAAVLREAITRGDLPKSTNSEELATFLLNSYEGALTRSKADRTDKSLENFLYFAFNVLLKKP